MLEPDRVQIENFVTAIFRHAGSHGFVAVRSFYEDEDMKPARISGTPLKGGLPFLIDVAEDDARRAAQHPRPIVFCPPLATFTSRDRAKEQDVAEGLALSVECGEGPQEARAVLEKILGPATVIVKSGGRWTNGNGQADDKLHLHWRLAKPASGGELAKLKQARDLAARIVGGDPSNKPVCHPIRWPGSWHRKAEPRLCQIETLDADREIDLDTAFSALGAAAPSSAKAASGNSVLGEEWDKQVTDIIRGASFHAPLVSLAARLVGSGVRDGSVVKLLRALMAASVATHDTLRWQSRYDSIPRIVSSAREKYAAGGTEHSKDGPVAALRWHGDHDKIPARAWLVEDLLPEIGSGLASGQWGTYKTFAALDLAAAVMASGRFVDHAVLRPGGVLYIAVDGFSEIEVRLQAVLETKYPQIERAPFAWTDQCPPLLERDSAAGLAAIAQQAAERMHAEFKLPLALVIIDTIAAAAGFSRSGEENDAALGQALMRQLAKLAQLTGTFVLGIDHFGKAAETGTRGSSAKEGAADTVLALLGNKAITGAVTDTRLALRKSRAGASGQEFPFSVRVVDVGVGDTSLVIEWLQSTSQVASKAEGSGWSKSLRLLQRALMNVLVEYGSDQQPFHDGPAVRAVDIEIVRTEFYKSYAAEGDARQKQNAKRQAFNRAIRDAQERSLIGVREVGEATLIWLVRGETAR